jgi:hypothetical protein
VSHAACTDVSITYGTQQFLLLPFISLQMVEDYINMAGNLVYPQLSFGPYGGDPQQGLFPFERPTMYGILTCGIRRPSIVECWAPIEVAKFEGALSIYGKHFHKVARAVGTKSCQDVIAFYYLWKKTDHYRQWKSMYKHEMAIQLGQDSDDEAGTPEVL